MTPRHRGTDSRRAVLDVGRAAAAARRRADSEACRQRVLDVLTSMRRSRRPLGDAEITRRAGVNPQYLQRHRDLKAEAEAVRAFLAGDQPRAAAAAAARKEAALEVENRMLLEQNAQLRKDLDAVQRELRQIRLDELAARSRDGELMRTARDAELAQQRRELEAAVAAERQARADLQALRNVNQRLIVENSRLLDGAARWHVSCQATH